MKHASEMTPAERAEALAEIKRAVARAEAMPTDRRAADMSAAERAEWLREHIARTRS